MKTDVLTSIISKKYKIFVLIYLKILYFERDIGKRWLDDELFNVEHFSKMGRKDHKLTKMKTCNTFEQVVKLKKDVIDKILHFEKQMSQAETVKDFATAFYESMEYFELPNQLMTERDELD